MRYLIPFSLVFASLSCSTTSKPAAVADQSGPRLGPVICSIASRNQTIIVRAGNPEPTYSVRGSSGEVLVRDMTIDMVARKNPGLSDRIKSLQACEQWAGD